MIPTVLNISTVPRNIEHSRDFPILLEVRLFDLTSCLVMLAIAAASV